MHTVDGHRLYRRVFLGCFLLACSLGTSVVHAADPPDLPTIAAKTKSLRAFPGFLPLYWDERTGHLWLEIRQFDTELLYQVSLTAGLGSNLVGLDRNQL